MCLLYLHVLPTYILSLMNFTVFFSFEYLLILLCELCFQQDIVGKSAVNSYGNTFFVPASLLY